MATPLEAPGPDVSIAGRFLGPTATFLALDIILYAARMYTRTYPSRRLGMDDLTCTLSMGLMIIVWALTARSIGFGMGRHNYYISTDDQMKAAHLLFAAQPLWAWSVGFGKVSMACMLLRIMRSKAWSMFLYVIIAVQLINATAFMFVVLLQCRPLTAAWNPLIEGSSCWSPVVVQIAIYINGAISIVTDFIFTLLPFTFISKMNLPLRQKVVLCALMGLGLFATAAGIVKLTLVKTYTHGGDPLFHEVDLYMWGYLEQEMSIIALCVPCLKALFEKVLRKLSLVSSSLGHSGSQKTRSGYVTFGNSKSQRSRTQAGHELDAMRSRTMKGDEETQSQESILHKDGNILKTQTTEITFETASASASASGIVHEDERV